MTKMTATLMHGDRGGEGRYVFDMDAPFDSVPPAQIMESFLDWLRRTHPVEMVDCQVAAAHRSPRADVVTVIGEMDFGDGNQQPFMCMFAPA